MSPEEQAVLLAADTADSRLGAMGSNGGWIRHLLDALREQGWTLSRVSETAASPSIQTDHASVYRGYVLVAWRGVPMGRVFVTIWRDGLEVDRFDSGTVELGAGLIAAKRIIDGWLNAP